MKTITRFNHGLCLKAAARVVALSALFGFGATAAIAAPQSESRSANTSLAGLDLSTPEGMRTARERTHETALSLCSDFSLPADFHNCVDDAESAALRQLELLRQMAIARASHASNAMARN